MICFCTNQDMEYLTIVNLSRDVGRSKIGWDGVWGRYSYIRAGDLFQVPYHINLQFTPP